MPVSISVGTSMLGPWPAAGPEERPAGLAVIAGRMAGLVQPAMVKMRAAPDKNARRMIPPQRNSDDWALRSNQSKNDIRVTCLEPGLAA